MIKTVAKNAILYEQALIGAVNVFNLQKEVIQTATSIFY